jgi:hypothetical protein
MRYHYRISLGVKIDTCKSTKEFLTSLKTEIYVSYLTVKSISIHDRPFVIFFNMNSKKRGYDFWGIFF